MTQNRLALIGGTSLLESPRFNGAEQTIIETPYGTVTLLDQDGVVFLQRHGLEGYTPPHLINHKANIHALHQAGVEHILAIGSVGSLHRSISPGTLVVPDDFYAPHICISFFEDHRGHTPPGFNLPWRETILGTWMDSKLQPPKAKGVYCQTIGPRFETPAEIESFKNHAHVVGMTVASECILAGELDLPYAAVCMVDNYANGISKEMLSYESFKKQVHANEAKLIHVIETLIQGLPS